MTPPRLDEGSEREALKWCAAALQALIDSRGERGSVNMVISGEKKSLEEVLDMADAALSTGRLGGEWLPISTAPATGTFLVYMPEERTQMQVAKWRPNVKTIGNSFAFDLTEPTHWMPLPPAPAAQSQGDRNG